MAIWTQRAEGHGRRAPDLAEVRRALALLADPEAGVQLQYAPFHSGSWKTFSLPGCLGGHPGPQAGVEAACAWVGEIGRSATGVYYALNPVPVDLDHSLRVADVLRRRWLLVDIDRAKALEPDEAATEAEHEAARSLALDVRDHLDGLGWPAPLLVDSGNGFHLLYRVDLPNDGDSRVLLRECLRALADRFDGERGAIGRECHDARRIAKLPGTWARRGTHTEERPHRMCRLLHVPAELVVVGAELLRGLTDRGAVGEGDTVVDAAPTSPFRLRAGGGGELAYARAALERECGRMALTPPGQRNAQLYRSGAALGNLVGAGLLSESEVFAGLLAAARAAGCNNERKDTETVRRGIEDGKQTPRGAPETNGHLKNGQAQTAGGSQKDGLPDIKAEDVATIEDLERAGAEVQWVWESWIPLGVLTAIAAVGGTGKTRFCADLVRRIAHQEPWPDGAEMTLPGDALALWVVSDNHHDELVSLCRSFRITASVRLNASRSDPYGGVTLETPDDYAALEARIRAVRPALVIIDTVGNATDRNLSRQEEAKAFYQPLQIMARRYRCAILCLTHLNAAGQFLGRRVLEKVRVAIRMDQFEGEPRRRLEAPKTFSKKPEPLGVTMGDCGNEYDSSPPEPPDPNQWSGERALPAKLREAADWLQGELTDGPQRVSLLIDKAKAKGVSMGTLYRAREIAGAEEEEMQGKKWWRLAPDEVVL